MNTRSVRSRYNNVIFHGNMSKLFKKFGDKFKPVKSGSKLTVLFRDDQDKYRCGCILGRRLDDAVQKTIDYDVEEICTCNLQNGPVTKKDEVKNDCAKCKVACNNVALSEEENLQFKQYLLDLSSYKSILIFNTDVALSPSPLLKEDVDLIVTCCKMESECLRLMARIEYNSGKALDKEFLDKLEKSKNSLIKDLSNFIPDEYKHYGTISRLEFEAMNLCICGNKRKPLHNVALLDTVKTGISKEFFSKLSGFLCESDINVHTINEDQQNEYNSYPLIVVCLNDSRLLTDIDNSLDKVQREDMSRVALITLHIKMDDYSEPGDSARALKLQDKKRNRQLGLITDWFYKTENKEKNNSTKDEIITFIKRKR